MRAVKVSHVKVDLRPGVELHVFGAREAVNLQSRMEQAFFVKVDGWPTARAELPADLRADVQAHLKTYFPEHARI